jgi:creatinine amidohydrolase
MRQLIRSMAFSMTLGILLLILAGSVAAQAPPQMRTRYFTALTNFEVENYLQRNDLIYIPVGMVQAHGVLPVDCAYIAAEAFALKMAGETDGLVFPNMQFTYPGDGAIGRGTVQVSPSEGLAYMKAIARSLLRQGFKRQIYVTSNDAAAPQTVSTLALEFFFETRNPVLYLDADIISRMVNADFTKILFGAYSILGRLDDIPVNLTPEIPEIGTDEGLRKLQAVGASTGAQNGTIGFFQTEDKAGPTGKAVTAEQRAALAKEGAAMIEAAIKAADIKKVAQSLRDHQRFTREYLIPRFDGVLP